MPASFQDHNNEITLTLDDTGHRPIRQSLELTWLVYSHVRPVDGGFRCLLRAYRQQDATSLQGSSQRTTRLRTARQERHALHYVPPQPVPRDSWKNMRPIEFNGLAISTSLRRTRYKKTPRKPKLRGVTRIDQTAESDSPSLRLMRSDDLTVRSVDQMTTQLRSSAMGVGVSADFRFISPRSCTSPSTTVTENSEVSGLLYCPPSLSGPP